MPEYDNPAGRLHALLEQFGSTRRESIGRSWARVLGVSETDVPLHLGRVGTLLRDVERAAKETEQAAFEPIHGHLQRLSNAIYPMTEPFSAHVANVAPDAAAMEMLLTLSAYLKATASEGPIPDEDELNSLKANVRELIEEVRRARCRPRSSGRCFIGSRRCSKR